MDVYPTQIVFNTCRILQNILTFYLQATVREPGAVVYNENVNVTLHVLSSVSMHPFKLYVLSKPLRTRKQIHLSEIKGRKLIKTIRGLFSVCNVVCRTLLCFGYFMCYLKYDIVQLDFLSSWQYFFFCMKMFIR